MSRQELRLETGIAFWVLREESRRRAARRAAMPARPAAATADADLGEHEKDEPDQLETPH